MITASMAANKANLCNAKLLSKAYKHHINSINTLIQSRASNGYYNCYYTIETPTTKRALKYLVEDLKEVLLENGFKVRIRYGSKFDASFTNFARPTATLTISW